MNIIVFPGLIDTHVHLRDPGQTEKEDFYTGTCAALAGGFTTVLDMPNNKFPVTTEERLDEKIKLAQKKAVCDIGFYFGSLGDNLDEFKKVNPPAGGGKVFGIKLYLNLTTGGFIIDKTILKKVYENWKSGQPILVHSEENVVNDVLSIVKKTGKKTHFCHIASRYELSRIIKAKEDGLPVTCGVTPHHLFLTENDIRHLGPYGTMKPPLHKQSDIDYLWKNIKKIDIIESDHAPHTITEKESGQPPSGVTGLETTLPLLLNEVANKRLTIEEIVRLCYANPRKIFNIKTDKNSRIEVDLNESYFIDNKDLKTKCGWTPFHGWKVKGRVKRVFIRGKKVFADGKILVKKSFGKIIFPN